MQHANTMLSHIVQSTEILPWGVRDFLKTGLVTRKDSHMFILWAISKIQKFRSSFYRIAYEFPNVEMASLP